MGVKDWWAEAMGTFRDLPPEYLSVYSGKRLAVDQPTYKDKDLKSSSNRTVVE